MNMKTINNMRTSVAIFAILATLYANAQDTLSTLAQERTEYLSYLKKEFELTNVPVILYDENELSTEEFTNLPEDKIGFWGYLLPDQSVKQMGEKGKNGIIYLASDDEMWQYRDDGSFYSGGHRPAEFPCGEDSLKRFIHKTLIDPTEIDSIWASVYLDYYMDDQGQYLNAEVNHITFVYPERIDIKYYEGKHAGSDMIAPKYRKYMEKLREITLNAAKKIPQFKPATFWLKHVKYKREIYMVFRGDSVESYPKYEY